MNLLTLKKGFFLVWARRLATSQSVLCAAMLMTACASGSNDLVPQKEKLVIEKFLLIDGAMAYKALTASEYFTTSGASWYTALLPHPDLRLAGPLLIAPSRMPLEHKAAITAEIQRLAKSFPNQQHFSYIDSQQTLETLTNHLKSFTYFGDSKGQPYGLRFADNRVLSYLPSVLTTSQWDAWTAPMERWQFHDRTGSRQELALNETRRKHAGAPQRLAVSQEQINQLIHAGEADALLAKLNLEPEAVTATDAQKNYDVAQQCVAKWQASGSTDRSALLIFGRKVFASDGAVLGDPARVQQLLRSAIAAVQ